MNESDLEAELRALRPVPPTARLLERIAAELSTNRERGDAPRAGVLERPWMQRHPWFAAMGWAGAGAAAVLLAMVAWQPRVGVKATADAAIPVAIVGEAGAAEIETSSELIAATEEELSYEEEQEPTRRVRFTFLETHTWKDPDSGALITVEVPREELLLIPVAMQ